MGTRGNATPRLRSMSKMDLWVKSTRRELGCHPDAEAQRSKAEGGAMGVYNPWREGEGLGEGRAT